MTNTSVKTVLITGASGALGRAVTRHFKESGCTVIGTDLGANPSDEIHNENWIQARLSESDEVEQKFKPISSQVDALIHCAGGFRFSPISELSDLDFQFLVDANLKSSFYLARHFSRSMKVRGFGRMVFVGAQGSRNAGPGMAAYAASKAGVHALVEALAKEMKEFDINVNAVLPTTLDTPANRKDMPTSNFSQWVSLTDLAQIIFSLTQPSHKAIHGVLIPVSGRISL